MTTRHTQPLAVGVDLGGTKVEAALVDASGKIIASERHPTNASRGAEGVIGDIVACVRGCLGATSSTVAGLGIGVAGQVEPSSGVVRSAPNLRWRDVALRDLLRDALGIPVTVINDVQAATLGEWRHGAGWGLDDMVCVFVGTGIGGGIVSGGRFLSGASGTAGEIGHTTVVTDGRKCHCPSYGCLEAYAGGWAIAERARQAVRTGPRDGAKLMEIAGSVEQITAATVSQAYDQGDAFARRLVEQTAHYLAAGLIGIVNALNPQMLIFGGGVIDGVPDLVTRAEPYVRAHALTAAAEHLRFVRAALGPNAVAIGAATIARAAPKDSPSRHRSTT